MWDPGGAVYGIQAILRLRRDETIGLAENIFSTPVSRDRWVTGGLVTALLGTAVIQFSLGNGLGIGYAATTGDAGALPTMVAAALVVLPAIWALVGIAVLLFGVASRLAAAVSYSVLGAFFLLELLAELGRIDGSILQVSPYTHMPSLLLGRGDALSVVVILALGIVLARAGARALRTRDLSRT